MPDRDDSHEAILAASIRVPERVVFRDFGHETVVLNLETGIYHGLNPTAGRMFEALAETDSVAAAADRLVAEFDQAPPDRVREDLTGFCRDLLARDLLEYA